MDRANPAMTRGATEPDPRRPDATTLRLDERERPAIALAIAVEADLALMDEQDGAAVAGRKGLAATGTLGVLDLAARRGLAMTPNLAGVGRASARRSRAR